MRALKRLRARNRNFVRIRTRRLLQVRYRCLTKLPGKFSLVESPGEKEAGFCLASLQRHTGFAFIRSQQSKYIKSDSKNYHSS